MCQIVNRAAVNLHIGVLYKIPSICCKNHCLQSKVILMINSTPTLKTVIDKVQNTMRDIKRSNKNSAVLRNLTHWRHILPGNTR